MRIFFDEFPNVKNILKPNLQQRIKTESTGICVETR